MRDGILVVSFGTTHREARKRSLDEIEKDIKKNFDGYCIYHAYTSKIVRERIFEMEGVTYPGVEEALLQMAEAGIENVFIQPTHVIPGEEYDKALHSAARHTDRFLSVKTGNPLLWSEEDFCAAADILSECYHLKEMEDKSAAILMGHGSGHSANACYARFQETLAGKGLENVFVSTVEGTPDFDETFCEVEKHGIEKLTLIPFMTVAGDHVSNDMAGEGADSWKNRLAASGYQVNCIRRGLGEIAEIRDIYVKHLKETICRLP